MEESERGRWEYVASHESALQYVTVQYVPASSSAFLLHMRSSSTRRVLPWVPRTCTGILLLQQRTCLLQSGGGGVSMCEGSLSCVVVVNENILVCACVSECFSHGILDE